MKEAWGGGTDLPGIAVETAAVAAADGRKAARTAGVAVERTDRSLAGRGRADVADRMELPPGSGSPPGGEDTINHDHSTGLLSKVSSSKNMVQKQRVPGSRATATLTLVVILQSMLSSFHSRTNSLLRLQWLAVLAQQRIHNHREYRVVGSSRHRSRFKPNKANVCAEHIAFGTTVGPRGFPQVINQ